MIEMTNTVPGFGPSGHLVQPKCLLLLWSGFDPGTLYLGVVPLS